MIKVNSPKAIIIANGNFPTHHIPLYEIERATFIICCDGAANETIKHNIIPDIIIGDGDSISKENRKKYKDIIHIIEEQETNDLTKAVNYLVEHNYTKITIVGGTGKREDHSIGNIGLLMEYSSRVDVHMITDNGCFYPCKNSFTAQLEIGTQISIFNFGAQHLQAKGLVYPIYDFKKWWEGTLNEVQNSNIEISAEGYFLVYVAFRN